MLLMVILAWFLLSIPAALIIGASVSKLNGSESEYAPIYYLDAYDQDDDEDFAQAS